MSDFVSRLQLLKSQKNITQKSIPENIGISLRAYQYYEKGQREPSMSVLIALADLFDVSLDYLVGRSDDPERR